MFKHTHILAWVTALLLLAACDEDTATLGVDMMPKTDLVTKNYQVYDVTTESYPVGDAVLARTNMSYLGRFTDSETNTTVKSDFLAQFHIDEGFTVQQSVQNDSCTRFDLRLFIDDYVGDSLQNFRLSVYELNQPLDPNADYYTNIDPEKYYDKAAQPIATKWFTISDRTIKDKERWANTYKNNILVSLPTTLGTRIIRDFKYRGCSAKDTIHRWPSVRAGEEKWIFPYQENCDVMFNTAMLFELAVIREQAIPILEQVPERCEEYAEAYRLLKFLKYLVPIPDKQIPPTSLLREFLGGSSFKY